ncbi:MAG: polysaccharide export protein [Proteobacteria bacterium]|nr:polysaccharide export protein [Cystobacterineae bacterium]MCL2258393.1 polysaccharide export protein [Cystobacterineae bacterium]MCL2315095.1 polysaccharide export protein [Pseudomonadota bacterium]
MSLCAWLSKKNEQLSKFAGRKPWVLLGCLCLGLSTACPVRGTYVLVDRYEDSSMSDGEYVIRPGDVIAIRVFQHDNMSAQGRVRADGRLSIPLLNEVTVAGYTPMALAQQLQVRLKEYINTPSVTVSLEEIHQLSISVLGEVNQAGIYTLASGSGVLQAIAAASGTTNFAKRNIFVLREEKPGQPPIRILFGWEALSRAEGEAARFKLRPGDVVLVE